MHAKTLGAIVTCLVGMALATAGGGVVADCINIASPTRVHHDHLRIDNHNHVSLIKYDVQQQARSLAMPPNGPVYRCHDPHPELFVS
jgi:hypothetical protein